MKQFNNLCGPCFAAAISVRPLEGQYMEKQPQLGDADFENSASTERILTQFSGDW
jgi:hypothetical protein